MVYTFTFIYTSANKKYDLIWLSIYEFQSFYFAVFAVKEVYENLLYALDVAY